MIAPTLESGVLLYIDIITALLSITLSLKLLFSNLSRSNRFSPQSSNAVAYENLIRLISLYLRVIALLKLFLFFYLFFAMDELSNIIKGAMCGVGIFGMSNYLLALLFFKFLLLITIFFIYPLDKINIRDRYQKSSKNIAILLHIVTVIAILEALFLAIFIGGIDIVEIASCCSVIFESGNFASLKNLYTTEITYLYISSSIALFISNLRKIEILSALFSPLFLISSLLFITFILSPYIYELPTHICPFCILKYEYNFIGYPLYIALISTFWLSLAPLSLRTFSKKSHHQYLKLANLLLILFSSITIYKIVTSNLVM